MSAGNTEARERLAAAVEALGSTEGFRDWLRVRAAFHRYSLNNTLLIVSQCPDAERVAGYKTWQSLGRQVRKGERGIRIFAPMVCKRRDESGERTEDTFVMFRCVSVFDVSQTDGEPLPEAPEWVSLEGDCPDLADELAAVAMGAGLTIVRETLDGTTRGLLDREGRRIIVGQVGSGVEAAAVVAHELGHYFDPWLAENPGQYREHRGDCEAVAEAVSCIVLTAHGIEAKLDQAAAYVAGWTDGNGEKVRELAARIDTAARAIMGES